MTYTQPEFVTEEQIAKAMSVTREQVRVWAARLDFPPSVGTDPVVWERAAIEAWVAEQRRRMGM